MIAKILLTRIKEVLMHTIKQLKRTSYILFLSLLPTILHGSLTGPQPDRFMTPANQEFAKAREARWEEDEKARDAECEVWKNMITEWEQQIDWLNPNKPILVPFTETMIPPLITAVSNERILLIIKLLKAGANPNPVEKKHLTPLETVLKAEYRYNDRSAEIVEILIRYGANPSSQNNDQGWTALHVACAYTRPHLKTMRILLEGGRTNWQLRDKSEEIYIRINNPFETRKIYKCVGRTPYNLLLQNKLLQSKYPEEIAPQVHLLESMEMFQSYDHYNSLRKSHAGQIVLTAFWQYVDGNVALLKNILQGNPERPPVKIRSMFTPQAVERILQKHAKINCEPLVQQALEFENDRSYQKEAYYF